MSVLDWFEETHDIGDSGRNATREATDAERTHLARELGLLAIDVLAFSYRIRPLSEGRYRLAGELTADATQACVVTLDSVPAHIREPVDLEFWPAHMLDAPPAEGEHSILEGDDPEALGAMGRIDTGRIAVEVLSAALDPYPRKQGAEFAWSGAEDDEKDGGRKDSPFAALEKLKSQEKK